MGQSPGGENYTENPKDYILVQGNADMKNGKVVPRVWTTQVTKKADPEDIILSVRAPVGDVGKTDYPVVLGRGVAGIKGNAFIFQTLSRMKEIGFWTRYSSGSTFESINSADLKDAVIQIPNIEEQIKIGEFFTKLDDTIALHQQKQRQIRSLKQGFIKNLFPNNKNSAPRIRFSIFNDDWNQRNASEIFTSVSDKNYPELPVLSASQEKGMVLRESNGIDIKYDQKSTGTYKRVLPGQFVMHLRSFQGGFAYSTIEGITSPAYTILAFRNKEDHYPLFWKSIFSSKNFIKRLEAITYGIRDGRSISYADFSTLRFWIPSYEEQKQIGDFIESIDATIAFYQRQIDMMQSLKKELLNKMFI